MYLIIQRSLAHDGQDGDEDGVDMQGVIAHAARRDLFDSQLAHELVMEWSWGSLSAVAVCPAIVRKGAFIVKRVPILRRDA